MAGWLKLLQLAVATGFIVGRVGRTMAFRVPGLMILKPT